MSPRSAINFITPFLLSALALGGCADGDEAVLHVFSTHHGTPADGAFPELGNANMPRRFEHGDWQVTLLESFVTISGVTLMACDGTPFPIDMFRGPCPENFRAADLETVTVGELRAPPGDYCSVEITYGPYETPTLEEQAVLEPHEVPGDSAVLGASIYLRGGANLEELSEPIPFELSLRKTLVVEIDLGSFDGPGRPMHLDDSGNFPSELTIAKTYDRFLVTADWSNFDEDAVENRLANTLEQETRIFRGQVIDASWFEQSGDE